MSGPVIDTGTGATDRRARQVKRMAALRNNCFAATTMLVIEFVLGIWTNIYVTVPDSDQGNGALAAFGHAVSGGPVILIMHAILGTLIVVSAITALIRAARLQTPILIVLASASLVAVCTAWLAGSSFVSNGRDSASFVMATATGTAILGYALLLFITGAGTDRNYPEPPG
jgi:hypothetical protein